MAHKPGPPTGTGGAAGGNDGWPTPPGGSRMTPQGRAQAAPDADADDATVIQFSRHEPEHFTMLFRRHAPHIQRYVVRRLGPDAADDIVAETFLLAFRHRDRYDAARADA